MSNLLAVSQLGIEFGPIKAPFRALHEITFTLSPGDSLCLVGSSGAGKSSLALAILGLLPTGSRRFGSVSLPEGPNLTNVRESELRDYRRTGVGTLFQDAPGSLIPGVPIGQQLEQVFRFRRNIGKKEALVQARMALEKVGLSDHDRILRARPAELSGGMCQRIMLCLTLAAPGPLRLLVADEPLSALDSVSAAQILDLLLKVQKDNNAIMLFITHDVRLVSRFDWVMVLSQGRSIEMQRSAAFLVKPQSHEGERLLHASRSLGQSNNLHN